MKSFNLFFLFVFLKLLQINGQKQAYNMCYGNNSLLSFSTSPPSQFSTTAMVSIECYASISDDSGNLLFYGNGETIYNASHTVMANGTGLMGNMSTTHGMIIIKKPASNNLYYVFTLDHYGGSNGLRYSIVDMNLAAGMGSVTVKNVLLYAPSTEKAVAVRHCNNVDAWIVTHEQNSNGFRSYLLSSAGVNTTAVISNVGNTILSSLYSAGQMKVSPNGKKLGLVHTFPNQADDFELYDFDNSTGIVSNYILLLNQDVGYGCEFSHDGTKFYANLNNLPQPNSIYQWDLCAGSNSAIVASRYAITGSNVYARSLQRTPDGKIFVVTQNNFFGAINNPNLSGINCGYTSTLSGLTMSLWSGIALPNFINSDLRIPRGNFTISNVCNQYSFSALPSIGNTCAYAANTVSSVQWNFGEPSSGAANTSTINTPTHSYANNGTYTVQLILQYDCYRDTIKQVVQVNIPVLSVSGKTVICTNDKLSLTVSGANTYSWSSGVTTANYTTTPNASIVYTVTGTNTTNLCSSSKVVSVSVNACLGLSENKNANILNIYPNPSKGMYKCEVNEESELWVFNELGVMVYEAKLIVGENKLDLRHLKSGLYFAHVQSKSSKVIYKIFKEE